MDKERCLDPEISVCIGLCKVRRCLKLPFFNLYYDNDLEKIIFKENMARNTFYKLWIHL